MDNRQLLAWIDYVWKAPDKADVNTKTTMQSWTVKTYEYPICNRRPNGILGIAVKTHLHQTIFSCQTGYWIPAVFHIQKPSKITPGSTPKQREWPPMYRCFNGFTNARNLWIPRYACQTLYSSRILKHDVRGANNPMAETKCELNLFTCGIMIREIQVMAHQQNLIHDCLSKFHTYSRLTGKKQFNVPSTLTASMT